MVAHCFESDPRELLALVHDRHPVWTRLELAKGAQGNFRMLRDPPGTPMGDAEGSVRNYFNQKAFRDNFRMTDHSPGTSYLRSQALSRSEEHTSELQSPCNIVCRLLLEKK